MKITDSVVSYLVDSLVTKYLNNCFSFYFKTECRGCTAGWYFMPYALAVIINDLTNYSYTRRNYLYILNDCKFI